MTVKTIILKGNSKAIRKEAIVATAVTPGYLVKRNSANKLIPHGTAGGAAVPAFCVENEVVGQDIDTDYAVNDTGLYGVFAPGTEVFALLAASAAAITIDDMLESAGDGTMRILASGVALAQAVEAVDNSGGGSEARIKIELV